MTNVDQMFQEIYTAILTINSTLDTAITTGLANSASKVATYITSTNQTSLLPNSRNLVAGTGISFNDGTPNVRTISASVSPGGSSGDYQYNNAGAFAGGAVKRINSGRTDIKDGVTAQELRLFNTESGAGANYELIKLLGGQLDIFSEPCFSFIADSAGTGVPQGIEFKTVGTSISFRIAGNFPAMILYHDPTSNGGISLIPNGSGFIGSIFCDQSGSFMWTPGGFAVPHMIDLLTPSTKALIFGKGASGSDFAPRYLTFDTTNSLVGLGHVIRNGTGQNVGLVLDGATNNVVANLPAAPPKGTMLTVNNALAPVIGNAVAAGGAAFAAVMWNGAAWNVFSI
jgi:hypothetical protein